MNEKRFEIPEPYAGSGDIRILKTRRSIEQTFLAMRERLSLEKIRVEALCREALVNKSTFYRYYTDVFDLSDKIENAIIDAVYDSLETTGAFPEDPLILFNELNEKWRAYQEAAAVLFSGRSSILTKKTQRKLRSLLETDNLDFDSYVRLIVAVDGTSNAMVQLQDDPRFDAENVTAILADIIKKSTVRTDTHEHPTGRQTQISV